MWTQEDAVKLCCTIEALAPPFGCHIALTGGTLYKAGARKDIDIIVYRIRQSASIDVAGFMTALATIGITTVHDYGFCYKALYENRNIDFLFPDRPELPRGGSSSYGQ